MAESADKKRAAPESATEDAPEAKKSASGCSWGATGGGFGAVAASGGGGGFGAVAASGSGWGGGAATSFAAIASTSGCSWGGGGGGGFGAVASSGGDGFASFSGSATTFVPTTGSSTAEKPRAASAATSASETEAPSSVEAAQTGEEDEICVYRVRAKLFRLEIRMESKRPPVTSEEAKANDGEEGAAAGADADKPATAEAEAAAKPADAAPAVAAKDSKLNPDAQPFVPKAADAAAAPAAARTGDKGDDEDEDEGEDEGDDDDKPAQPEEPAGEEELVETTRWAERGIGQLRLLVHKPLSGGSSTPFPRVVMRQEHVGRLILNETLHPTTAPAARVTDTSIRIVLVDSASTVPQSYLLRVKTPAEGAALLARINETIPKPA